ncbi:MAG: hypothetical protein J1E85_06880 [Ruminococcus sp.]|nr:hypothetical protein [Ruminococcus sp.]
MNVNFNGYNENVATFVADSKLTNAGVPVKISADGTVTVCTSGDKFCGICVAVRDGYAAVQLSGYVTVKTSTKLALGFTKLAAGASGAVAVNENGREHLVINSTASEAGIIL